MTQRQLEFDEFTRSATPAKGLAFGESSMTNFNFNEMEVIDILIKVKEHGKVDMLMEKIRLYSVNDMISTKEFITALANHGSITEMEARKVALYLDVTGKVKVSKF